jgi:hypothetical protein
VDDGIWSIYFCNVLLARLDERDYSEAGPLRWLVRQSPLLIGLQA